MPLSLGMGAADSMHCSDPPSVRLKKHSLSRMFLRDWIIISRDSALPSTSLMLPRGAGGGEMWSMLRPVQLAALIPPFLSRTTIPVSTCSRMASWSLSRSCKWCWSLMSLAAIRTMPEVCR